jgi:hypothetical protein
MLMLDTLRLEIILKQTITHIIRLVPETFFIAVTTPFGADFPSLQAQAKSR